MQRDNIKCWLTDMDGVLMHENEALPGALELIVKWQKANIPYLILTNNSIHTSRDLAAMLSFAGLEVPETALWTSSLATAEFLKKQRPSGGSAFVIGEAGILTALHEAGFIITNNNPEFVVVGDTRNYSFQAISEAVQLVNQGARFILTNPDATVPTASGVLPATGAIAALITKATGKKPYVVGKPNPIMFRTALNQIGAHSEVTAMIGDRMDTDISAGMEAGLHTILVLSGITDYDEVDKYPYRPDEIIKGVFELI